MKTARAPLSLAKTPRIGALARECGDDAAIREEVERLKEDPDSRRDPLQVFIAGASYEIHEIMSVGFVGLATPTFAVSVC